ncbi:hypothetical protein GW17_00032039 [Ensete ventricosum]|nr:hypothetical protein GW17_00032039 [Ensete ventricosum]RZS14503.1 hypothetical protein BHM03_00046199 [Ensete ventricosum]
MLYILHTELTCHLGLVLPAYIWMPEDSSLAPEDSSLAPEGCADSFECRLVDRGLGRLTHTRVNFWSLVDLQPLGVCYDVPKRVAYPWSEDLMWLASMGEAFFFASASFRSSVGSSVVNVYTKA